ncbi:sensor histidine kinase [Chryseolinea sp. T2]|uniref:sensor histidine kinase n=1 Tax=Chryseolinea sp. T2 TaxID=3129255 RepID=UPI003077F07B
MQRALWVIGLIFKVCCISAQTLTLSDDGRIAAGGAIMYIRDEADAYTIDNVASAPMHPVDPESLANFGFDRTPYWFRMQISNASSVPQWLMEINFSPLDRVDFFIQDETGAWTHKISGDTFPIEIRDELHRHPVFGFSFQQGEQRTIYLRVHTTSSVQVPIVFWTKEEFSRVSSHIQWLNGLFYGAMLLMTLYQLFLFLSVRDRITLFYVFTLIAMTNTMSFFQGYNFLYFHPNHPELNEYFAILTGPFFIISSTLLTRTFLDLARFNRILDRLLLANMFMDVIAMLMMLIFMHRISYKYHHIFILSHCLLACISAAYCLMKQYKPARYYLMAWIAPFLGAATFTLSNLGMMSGELSMNYASVMIGCVLQTLFISFALGDRWATLEKENRLAKELELKRNQEENERLEKEVKLRTNEIQQQNQQLEEVNNVKDKLFSVVSHDIKGPLSSLHLTLSLAKSGAISEAEFRQIATELDARLAQTTEFIDNLLQWAKLQMHGESFEPGCLELVHVVAEVVRLLEPECKQKNVSLVNNLSGSLEAYADINMVRSVLRNLLTNATKFTRSQGVITVSAYSLNSKIVVSVADSGVGIPKRSIDKIFTLATVSTDGTQREKGTGLGLLLCKEFVEKNGGKIWFETREGEGTTFYFSLPMYAAEIRAAGN